jgi:signal peptidase II
MPETPGTPLPYTHARARWAVFGVALLLGTALDLWTKSYFFATLGKIGEPHSVTSFFALTKATNPGAAFGMFRDQHTFFMLVTLAAFVCVPYFLHTARRNPRGTALVLGLILSGVVGNFWDRMAVGEVRDFLDFHTPATGMLHDLCVKLFGTDTWPTFNVADIFITGGAITIIAAQALLPNPDAKEDETP